MSKTILVLTPRLPYPVIGGDKLRIYNICDYLYKKGHRLTLVSFVEGQKEAELARIHTARKIFSKVLTRELPKYKSYVGALRALLTGWPLQVGYFWSKEMVDSVNQEIASGEYDVALVHLIRMAPYVARKNIRKILEMTDAISLNYSRIRGRKKKGFWGFIYGLEGKRVRRYEQECLERFDEVVVVSSTDKDYLVNNSRNNFSSKISVIPNGVAEDLIKFQPLEYDPNLIIFIGNLRSYQNQDAVFFFLEEIYSLIRKQLPLVKFRIIGAEPPLKLTKLNRIEGIEVTGEVDKVLDYAQRAAVSVAPLRIGAGIQNKILESLAMGIPVVTTSVAALGIEGARNKEQFLVADTPEEFASSVLRIIKDASLRDKLSRSGKEFVKNHHSWSGQLENYLKII